MRTHRFRLRALGPLVLVLAASTAAGLDGEPPTAVVQRALAAVGGPGGALTLPRTFRAELTTESYNADDGFVRATITESLATLPEGARFRSDHRAVKPEQGPRVHELAFYRAGKDMWRVAVSGESGELVAARIPPGNEDIRTLPHSLRHLAYILAHPERFGITTREEAPDSLSGRPCRVMAIDVTVDAEAISFRVSIEAVSGLPVRLTTLTTGCVVDYKDWKRFSGLMLPAEVVTRQEPDPANAIAGFEETTRLLSLDLAPEFAVGYFDIPTHAVRKD
jgi:hypothetical protein